MDFLRKKFKWNVMLLSEQQEQLEVSVENHWSPDYEGVEDEIGTLAATMQWQRDGKKKQWVPLAVTLAT